MIRRERVHATSRKLARRSTGASTHGGHEAAPGTRGVAHCDEYVVIVQLAGVGRVEATQIIIRRRFHQNDCRPAAWRAI